MRSWASSRRAACGPLCSPPASTGGRLWLSYFGIGGEVSEFEVDAYLHHSLTLPRLQRDLLAQAASEILVDLAPPRAPSAGEVIGGGCRLVPGAGEQEARARVQDGDVLDHEDPGPPED